MKNRPLRADAKLGLVTDGVGQPVKDEGFFHLSDYEESLCAALTAQWDAWKVRAEKITS